MASSLRSLLPRTSRPLRHLQTPAAAQFIQHRAQSTFLHAPDALDPKLTAVDITNLSIQKTTTPKPIIPNNELIFGKTFTDHMLSLEWTAGEGWFPPRITPYQNLSLDPATCVLHYAFEAFEGMKAYRAQDGSLRLFRPDKNMERLNRSCARIALPMFEGEKIIELIKQFVKLEERFIPS